MLNNVIRDIVFPQKIIYSEKVIKAEEILNSRITQVVMPFKDGTVIEKDGYIILDFGKEIYGNLRVLTGEKTGEISAKSCSFLRFLCLLSTFWLIFLVFFACFLFLSKNPKTTEKSQQN